MYAETDLVRRAKILFPDSKSDIEALDNYAFYFMNHLKKYYGNSKLKSVYDECVGKYKAICDLRRQIKIREAANEKEKHATAIG